MVDHTVTQSSTLCFYLTTHPTIPPGGKQSMLREGFMHGKWLSQPMSFPLECHDHELARKLKGIKRVLKERGLWPEPRGLVLECPKTHKRPGCDAGGGGCCARRVLEAERDFQDKRGRLQEGVDALSHHVLFYPKFLSLRAQFHWALLVSSQVVCKGKENCGYDFAALKTTVPKALASVSNASIHGFYRLASRTTHAHSAGMQYGAEEFKQTVYKSHHKVENKSKWWANMLVAP